MTRSRLFTHVRWLALAALAVSTVPAQAQELVIKMATLVPKDSVWERTLKEMGEQWKKDAKGRLKFVLYAGGIQGDDGDVIRKMRLGTIGAGMLTGVGMSDIDRSVLSLEVPLAFEDWKEFDCVMAKVGSSIDRKFEAKGFVVLAWTDGGWVKFFSKAPARVPDDLKKAKLYTWSGDDQYTELWKQAGFNPVPLSSTEISTALQTGLVNAVPTPVQAAVLLQWFEHAKNMLDINWAPMLGAIIVSKATWDKVPADLRPALQKSAEEAARKLRDLSRANEPKDIEALKKRGVNVVVPDAAAHEAWQKFATGMYPKIRGTFVPGEDMDAVLAARSECRKAGAR